MHPSVLRHFISPQSVLIILASSLVFLFGCSGYVQTPPTLHQATGTIISSPQSSIRTNQSTPFAAKQDGVIVAGGQWGVLGGSANGTITPTGLYTSPSIAPTPNTVDVVYTLEGEMFTGHITVVSPAPSIQSVSPQTITKPIQVVAITGSGFVPGSTIVVNTLAVSTTFIDSAHVTATLDLSHSVSNQIQLAVANSGPVATTSDPVILPVVFAPLLVSPSTISIRTNQSLKFLASQDGAVVVGGTWSVIGGSSNGTISQSGDYTSPALVPTPNLISVVYTVGDSAVSARLTIINSAPVIQAFSPQTITTPSQELMISGSGFTPGSLVMVNGATAVTAFVDSSHLIAKLSISAAATPTRLQAAVANPDPGAVTSDWVSVPIDLGATTVTSPLSWIRPNQSVRFSANRAGAVLSGGEWAVSGGASNGTITQTGDYTSPPSVPTDNAVRVMYHNGDTTAAGLIQIINSAPTIQGISPRSVTRATGSVTVTGSSFAASAVILVNSAAVPTTFVDQSHLVAKLDLSHTAPGQLQVVVANPGTGATASDPVSLAVVSSPVSVSASQSWLRTNQTVSFTALQDGITVSGGTWGVLGGSSNGTITQSGVFSSPSTVPTPNVVSVVYTDGDATSAAQIQLLNAVPTIQAISPQTITSAGQDVTVSGSGYTLGSMILVNSTPVATTYVDSTHLTAKLHLSKAPSALQIAIQSPDPGAMTTDYVSVPVNIPSLTVSPNVLTAGALSITVSGANISRDAVVVLDGKALATTSHTETSITASAYLPPWKTGTSVVGLVSATAPESSLEQVVPIASTAVTFEAAARFSTQAAFGPRPDVVQHIQQIGFDAFLKEQMELPAVDYPRDGFTPYHYLHFAAEGQSLLRLRLAWALQSFIATQGIFIQQSTDPIERKLERDATGNFRQLLGDITSDTSMGNFLNLTGNAAPSDPAVHPNQNFARELMQLFTLGPFLLNNDGTPKLDSAGAQIPTYDQTTVIDLSRALTGWVMGTPNDPYYTAFGMDYSQPLAAAEDQHDHGPKTLFGSVYLAAGRTAAQDRDAALDAIFAHPNVPPFVSRILIQRLVKSNPSPAYVQRIAGVFQDNGLGTRGDLAAVFRAILLDPEARLGDTSSAPDDGFLQDPLLFETFAMSVSSTIATDGQLQYLPGALEEPFWYANSVFAYFSPSHMIPGTTINSPEFQIFNNITAVLRSEALWAMINGGPGFTPNDSTWLYNNFSDVPSLVEALNHLLYYGRMTPDQKDAILDYCNSLDPNDSKTQLRSALFLALNGDSFNVSQ